MIFIPFEYLIFSRLTKEWLSGRIDTIFLKHLFDVNFVFVFSLLLFWPLSFLIMLGEGFMAYTDASHQGARCLGLLLESSHVLPKLPNTVSNLIGM